MVVRNTLKEKRICNIIDFFKCNDMRLFYDCIIIYIIYFFTKINRDKIRISYIF